MQLWIKRLHRVEDAFLVLLLSAMILLATTQIILRNFFDLGFIWADPLLRALVLWLALIGAAVATRENKHISIDVLSRFFSAKSSHFLQSLVFQFSAWICLIIAWTGVSWIQLDYADEVTTFAGIPAWAVEIIVPVSFALIGFRYFLLSVAAMRAFLSPTPIEKDDQE